MIQSRERSWFYMKRSLGGLAALAFSIVFGGCSTTGTDVLVIEKEPYERTAYRTVEVQRGDLQPEFTLRLQADANRGIDYRADEDGLVLEKVYVSVGDEVQEGQLLVSFQSDEIQQTLERYLEERDRNQLLIDHYTRLMQADPKADYQADIIRLQQDMEVANLYIEEAQTRLTGCQIVAEAPGTITYVSDSLQSEYYVPGKTLVREFCGAGNYTAYTEEDYAFEVGKQYTAVSGGLEYEMRLIDCSDGTLVFQPTEEMGAMSNVNWLTMTIEKPVIQDAVYVEPVAVYERNGMSYVYVLDENGYRDAVPVEAGEIIKGYQIIRNGLSGGEVVTMK